MWFILLIIKDLQSFNQSSFLLPNPFITLQAG